MAEYQIYLLGEGDRIRFGRDAECVSDEAALDLARSTLKPDQRAEVWQSIRCVGQVPKARRQSHDMLG